MLLAFGPLLLDTTVRTVVVGLLDGTAPAPIAGAVTGADAVWLSSPTPERVASAGRDTGLPVGVTVHDIGALDELAAAGAVAIECDSPAAIDAALDRRLTMWCPPAQAERAIRAGYPADRVVSEPGEAGSVTVAGATVTGDGPRTWGEVVRAAQGGARLVRTTDTRSVRRVVTVMDRLMAARSTTSRTVTT